MIKKISKITSILISSATVFTLMPTIAANADTVKKIDSEDGTVYDAVAYKDGKALIDGEINDTDGAYYYSNGKYSELDDVDSGSDYTAYGSKYANVDDGDYFVDLETGKVTDDSLDEDDEDDAASALRKEIKDSDRYKDSYDSTGNEFAGDKDIADLTLIPGNKFGESWYSAKYVLDISGTYASGDAAGSALTTTTSSGVYYTNIYTDAKGNYIDADYNLGKIKVETTSSSATIENSIDKEDLDDAKDASAKITASTVLGQDSNYLYRYAEITVKLSKNPSQKVTINNKEFTTNANGEVILPVIQKISKAQDSDDIDDGKYAKTVYNYVISDDDGKLNNTVKTFANLDDTKATVIGGKLALYNVTNKAEDNNVKIYAMTLKTKNGYYYTDLEDETTIEAEYNNDTEKTAFDIDVDGNIYVLDGGYVKKFDGTDDWDKIYKIDGSMDGLSVYDKDNMVVWSQDDEVYSLIGKKASEDKPTTPVITTGWTKSADGTWSYIKADGSKATGWLQDGGTWYFLKSDGVMATGWLNDNGTWYFLNTVYGGPLGAMKTGWIYSNGAWYFLSSSGAMKTGWINDNGTWYYLYPSGAMAASTVIDGYKLDSNGAWIK